MGPPWKLFRPEQAATLTETSNARSTAMPIFGVYICATFLCEVTLVPSIVQMSLATVRQTLSGAERKLGQLMNGSFALLELQFLTQGHSSISGQHSRLHCSAGMYGGSLHTNLSLMSQDPAHGVAPTAPQRAQQFSGQEAPLTGQLRFLIGSSFFLACLSECQQDAQMHVLRP